MEIEEEEYKKFLETGSIATWIGWDTDGKLELAMINHLEDRRKKEGEKK